jgi:hypothetical protein
MGAYNYTVTSIDIETSFAEGGVIDGSIRLAFQAESNDPALPSTQGFVIKDFRSGSMNFDKDIDIKGIIEGFHAHICNILNKVYTEEKMREILWNIREEIASNLLGKGFTHEPSIRDVRMEKQTSPVGFRVEIEE